MSFRCGIVGLPNVGKSTLFNAVTSTQNAEAANYPFCTIDPNTGSVIVPDERENKLVEMYNPKKIVPTTIEFVDIAGLVRGASKGEGLGNQFLSHIREVDAIVHIVRCFENENVIHVDNKVDPKSDIETIETELILKDLESIEKRIDKYGKNVKAGDKDAKKEVEMLEGLKEHLSGGRMAKYFTDKLTPDQAALVRSLHLLTDKKIIYVANVDEEGINGNKYSDMVKEIADKEGASFLILSVQIESEIAQLETEEEKKDFLKEMGIEESGLTRLIKKAYSILELITFFTAGEKEVHSWTLEKGSTAPQAAGEIHTDFEKGFIRAEIIRYEDLITLGSEQAVKEKGLLKVEGKEYIVQDGDVVHFRFNV